VMSRLQRHLSPRRFSSDLTLMSRMVSTTSAASSSSQMRVSATSSPSQGCGNLHANATKEAVSIRQPLSSPRARTLTTRTSSPTMQCRSNLRSPLPASQVTSVPLLSWQKAPG
jgi:hypothetical protein